MLRSAVEMYIGVSAMIGVTGLLLMGVSIWLPFVAYFSGQGFFKSVLLAAVFWPGLIALAFKKI